MDVIRGKPSIQFYRRFLSLILGSLCILSGCTFNAAVTTSSGTSSDSSNPPSSPSSPTLPVATLTGQPTGTSSTTTLNIIVGGTGVTHYKYKIVEAPYTVDCTSATGYSADIAVATRIQNNITALADGGIRLCVIGKDASDNYQLVSSSTIANWTKDVVVTTIYRSVGAASTALHCGSGSGPTIVSGLATFNSALPATVGVGDVVRYDDNNNNSTDTVAIIHSRIDSTHYTLRTAAGGIPADTVGATSYYDVYRAYASLADAEAGIENPLLSVDPLCSPVCEASCATLFDFDTWSGGRNLVSSDEQWNIALYADADDTNFVDINGWTTSQTNYLRLFTPYLNTQVGTTQRHSGTWASGGYLLSVGNTANDGTIKIQDDYVRVEGLRIESGDTSVAAKMLWSDSAGSVVLNNNILRSNVSTNSNLAIALQGAGSYTVYNNIIHPATGMGFGVVLETQSPSYIYNNTIIATGDRAVSNSSTAVLKNNIIQGAGGCEICGTGSYTGSDYNLNQGTVSTGGANDRTSKTVTFTNAAAENYTLSGSDTEAQNFGTDLSADVFWAFVNDIANSVRSGTWDIGASEAP